MYSYGETIIPIRVRHKIRDFCMGKIVYGAFVAVLALLVSLGSSGSALLASAVEPDIVEGHIVNVTAKIEMPFQAEELVVLNEILPNPEGLDSQDGLAGEWVELYNNGDAPVDVVGWYIKDAIGNTKVISSANTHTGSTIIGASGSGSEWLVVFMNAAVLNNTGDTVFLFDDEDLLKDSHAFGESNTDEDGDLNTSAGGDNDTPSGSETAGNEGKSIARIPDGTGAWIDPIPTPGGPNRLEEVVPPAEEPVVVQEEPEIAPATTGGGGAVPSIAGSEAEPFDEAQGEPPAETPAETPVETPAETEPVTTEESPVVTEEPPAATDEPAVTEAPATTEEPPPAVVEEPPVVTEEPPATTEEPFDSAQGEPQAAPDSTETPA